MIHVFSYKESQIDWFFNILMPIRCADGCSNTIKTLSAIKCVLIFSENNAYFVCKIYFQEKLCANRFNLCLIDFRDNSRRSYQQSCALKDMSIKTLYIMCSPMATVMQLRNLNIYLARNRKHVRTMCSDKDVTRK